MGSKEDITMFKFSLTGHVNLKPNISLVQEKISLLKTRLNGQRSACKYTLEQFKPFGTAFTTTTASRMPIASLGGR